MIKLFDVFYLDGFFARVWAYDAEEAIEKVLPEEA